MHKNAMRWLSRLKGTARGVQLPQTVSHDSGRIVVRPTCCITPKLGLPLDRGLCSSVTYRSNTTTASTPLTQDPTPGQTQNLKSPTPQWKLIALIFAASAGTAYLYGRLSGSSDDEDVINTSSFSAFTIMKREQVSPTAFIITLRPSAWVDPEELASGESEDDEGAGFLSKLVQDAWRHGLWSVEIKQPQLQIARHYTPLPPVVGGSTDEEGEQHGQPDIRILIRRMDGGEMSNYLSRQRVGDTIWLRGPHLGFDVARRLGTIKGSGDDVEGQHKGRRSVVFLAGGTGIAPALQIAHQLLDAQYSTGDEDEKPHVSILWANRSGADALGREESLTTTLQKPTSWFRFWGKKSSDQREMPAQARKEPSSSLALQIQDLKQRHGAHFHVSYFVDEEGSFIKAHDLKSAINSTSSPCSVQIDKNCTWHSAKAVEVLPDDNDAARSDDAYACTCTSKTGAESPGVNLVCVSGPDGFIAAYAGAKRWHEGNEMQGIVGGLLGQIRKDASGKMDDWLVLKL